MSTRCNIIIKKDKNTLDMFYRHHDGYVSGCGRDLSEICYKNGFDAETLHNALINYEDATFEPEGHTDNIHGDIEFMYVIDCEKKRVFVWNLREIFGRQWFDRDYEEIIVNEPTDITDEYDPSDDWQPICICVRDVNNEQFWFFSDKKSEDEVTKMLQENVKFCTDSYANKYLAVGVAGGMLAFTEVEDVRDMPAVDMVYVVDIFTTSVLLYKTEDGVKSMRDCKTITRII